MEHKEIEIPLSKIKGLDKNVGNINVEFKTTRLKSQLDKSEEVDDYSDMTTGTEESELDREGLSQDGDKSISKEEGPLTKDQSKLSEFDVKTVKSIDEDYFRLALGSFLNLLESTSLSKEKYEDSEIVVSSKLVLDLINSKQELEVEESKTNQLLYGAVIGVLVTLFLFLLVKII